MPWAIFYVPSLSKSIIEVYIINIACKVKAHAYLVNFRFSKIRDSSNVNKTKLGMKSHYDAALFFTVQVPFFFIKLLNVDVSSSMHMKASLSMTPAQVKHRYDRKTTLASLKQILFDILHCISSMIYCAGASESKFAIIKISCILR